MSVLSPIVGALLFAAVAVPLLALYFLRLRRTRRVISSSLPWVRRTEDLRANAPFQRIRPSLLLFLQMLLLALLALAVAQPIVRGWGVRGGRVVMLIDCSASMGTLDGAGGVTRLAEAKRQAIARAESLQGGGLFASTGPEIMVIAFADTAQVCTPFTTSLARVRMAIEAIVGCDERTRIEPALELARAQPTGAQDERAPTPAAEPLALELFSDGRLVDGDRVALRANESMTFARIGSPDTGNAGIGAAGCERSIEDAAQVQAFASLRNYGSTAVDRKLVLRSGGGVLGASPDALQVPPLAVRERDRMAGERRMLFAPFAAPDRRVLEFECSPGDAFPTDDRAFVALRAPRPLRVALIGTDASLRALLDALAPGSLQTFDRDAVEAAQAKDAAWAEGFDVVVNAGLPPSRMNRGRWLHFGPVPALDGLNPFGTPGRDFVQSMRGDHPALRQCNLNELVASRANRVAVQSPWQAIVEGGKSPLVVAGPSAHGFVIAVTFEPGDSNWPFQRSFVNFTAQAIELLAGMSDVASDESLEPGAMIRVRLPDGARDVRVTPPGGAAESMVRHDAEASWGPARRCGAYRIAWQGADGASGERWVAVNMLDAAECDVAAVDRLTLSGQAVRTVAREGGALDLWPWILGLAFVLLLAEWWIYHRQATR